MDAFSEVHFNCTIQELKPSMVSALPSVEVTFQLHHTGIKTCHVLLDAKQLKDFNCTIQELKRGICKTAYSTFENFNCTIQELKLCVCL